MIKKKSPAQADFFMFSCIMNVFFLVGGWLPIILCLQHHMLARITAEINCNVRTHGLFARWFRTIGDVSPFISILLQYVYITFILLPLSRAMNCENVSQRSENLHQNIDSSERESEDATVNSHWKVFGSFLSREVATCWHELHSMKKC